MHACIDRYIHTYAYRYLPCGPYRSVGRVAEVVVFPDKAEQVIQRDDAAEEALRHTCAYTG